jgi:hypothetical protein
MKGSKKEQVNYKIVVEEKELIKVNYEELDEEKQYCKLFFEIEEIKYTIEITGDALFWIGNTVIGIIKREYGGMAQEKVKVRLATEFEEQFVKKTMETMINQWNTIEKYIRL